MSEKQKPQRPAISARAAAVNTLIAAHRAEFDEYMTVEAKARGFVYFAPESDADKARRKIDDLLAKNPTLRSEYGPLGGPAPSGLDEFAPKASA